MGNARNRHQVECTFGPDCKKWRPGNICLHEREDLKIGVGISKNPVCLSFDQDYEYRKNQLKEEMVKRGIERHSKTN